MACMLTAQEPGLKLKGKWLSCSLCFEEGSRRQSGSEQHLFSPGGGCQELQAAGEKPRRPVSVRQGVSYSLKHCSPVLPSSVLPHTEQQVPFEKAPSARSCPCTACLLSFSSAAASFSRSLFLP